eukprot:4974445-Pyramimonas_sp.AAC.1
MAGRLRRLPDQFRIKQTEDMLWCDTREMRADPMTKGSIGRELLMGLENGQLSCYHNAVKLSEGRN